MVIYICVVMVLLLIVYRKQFYQAFKSLGKQTKPSKEMLMKNHQHIFQVSIGYEIVVNDYHSQTLTDNTIVYTVPEQNSAHDKQLTVATYELAQKLIQIYLDSIINLDDYTVNKKIYSVWTTVSKGFSTATPLPMKVFYGVVVLTKKAPAESRKDD